MLEEGKMMDEIDALYNETLWTEYAGKIGIRHRENKDYDEAWEDYVLSLIQLLADSWSEKNHPENLRLVPGMTKKDLKKICDGIVTKLMLFMLPWPLLEDGENQYLWDVTFLIPIPMMTVLRDMHTQLSFVKEGLLEACHWIKPAVNIHKAAVQTGWHDALVGVTEQFHWCKIHLAPGLTVGKHITHED
ncbi:hypothetical protein EWM64_g6626 [Hericium alpestre]|uniref:Uncharacterized protein n=1 Tax=Hericium alpestre TaxID=135208 RepID=A0A4Y9ZT44_9AGAM|nr:hypothetical protein EWM64_g6626 [Hericium alpestre]